jgi:aspartyl protease family protein
MTTPAPLAGALLTCALLLAVPCASAQTAALAGVMGDKALLIIDSSAPKSVATGETFKGVKVLSVRGNTAVVAINGKQATLRVGDAPANVGGGAAASGGNRVVMTAGSGGHFLTQGLINGKAVQLVVDTGASLVSLSAADADRLGLDYKKGQRGQVSTANGLVPAWRIMLDSVQIGDVRVYSVDSLVSAGSMPYVLLGNSFLSRFQMTRTNDQMVLEKRY